MAVRSPTVNIMIRAAEKAARRLKRDFGEIEQLQVSRKGPADFVSNADLASERTLREELLHARPDYGFMAEESAGNEIVGDGIHRFIVDPLDGTTNFLHGIPHFAISIALEREGELVAGVIYDPIKDEAFWAERGAGAFMNDRRLRVAGRTELSEALIATGTPFLGHGSQDHYLPILARLMPMTAGIRRYGSAALDLAYVAAGRFDGFFEYNLNAWDVAAGILLVKEAGGFVTSLGSKNPALTAGEILAANDRLHGRLLKIIMDR
ncbi:MAG: inositol monophosphatase family protein [Candidatus Symbiobacter sp.]|nr:inositol monophosphatase family protein [Candidatus Symbiobacter sp.]